jgi:hypothetical protein
MRVKKKCVNDRIGSSLKGANFNNPGSITRGKAERLESGPQMGANY